MLDLFDYVAGWTVYLLAGAIFMLIFWRFTGLMKSRRLAASLRAIMIALVFTPWYVATDQDLLAPAAIVVLLDAITIGGAAFVRALVPLVLSIILALIIALAGGLITRLRRGRRS